MTYRLHPKGTSARRSQERGNRAPTVIYSLRKWQRFPLLRTGDHDTVELIFDPKVLDAIPLTNVLSMSREDAGLLAKRLNQLLKDTKKS